MISIISAIISFIAMCIAIWQAIEAKKSRLINEKIYKEGQPCFQIIDSFDSRVIINNNSKKVILKFWIVISNLSNNNMTIKSVKLRVIGEEKNIILTPTNKKGLLFIGDNIGSKNSITKCAEFEIDKKIYYEMDIIEYVLEIEDMANNTQNIKIICLNEEVIQNEQTNKA